MNQEFLSIFTGNLAKMSLPGNETEIQLLLAKCIGREVKIPNLFLLYPWEVKVSPPDEKLEMEVELWRSRSGMPTTPN